MPKSKRTTPRTIRKLANTVAASTASSPYTASDSPPPPIQCVVVLMLEKRSFDHLFGKSPGLTALAENFVLWDQFKTRRHSRHRS